MKFAVIDTGGKQYKVASGDKIKIEKIAGEEGDKVFFDKVLLLAEEKSVKIGDPYTGDKVEAKTIRQARDKKKIVFRYHSKTRYRKTKGHRQYFTEVEII